MEEAGHPSLPVVGVERKPQPMVGEDGQPDHDVLGTAPLHLGGIEVGPVREVVHWASLLVRQHTPRTRGGLSGPGLGLRHRDDARYHAPATITAVSRCHRPEISSTPCPSTFWYSDRTPTTPKSARARRCAR